MDKVVWSALPPQSITALSMVFVVALSSSLDVAAIELELGVPLDYNRELSTVGLSNCISGMMGGYTGSYIFSQSIFSLRAGIRSRAMGYSLAMIEMLFVMSPVDVLAYVPNFLFGSMLVMICADLCYEWLWDVRTKISGPSYGVALATFCIIQVVGVTYGILGGILVHIACDRLGLDMGPTVTAEPSEEVPEVSEGEALLRKESIPESRKVLRMIESGVSLAGFDDDYPQGSPINYGGTVTTDDHNEGGGILV